MPVRLGRATCLAVALALVLEGCAGSSRSPPARASSQPSVAARAASRSSSGSSRPSWQLRKTVPDAVEVASGRAVVRAGEGLSQVAQRTGSSIGAMAAANNLAPPYVLRPNQVLVVPGGRYHSVRYGETGITIARAYGVPWNRVVALNQLAPPYVLEVGDRLLIPSARSVAQMSVEDRAAAFRIDIDDLITGSEPAAGTAPRRQAQAQAQSPASGRSPPSAAPAPVKAPESFAGGFAWPLRGRLLSSFGPKASGRYNDGINIAVDAGTPVRAAADGVVAYAGDGVAGFGGLILLKHGDDWVTAYAHAEALLVARGQSVKRGDPIARAGATGSVDEPQLHFEIRKGRTPVDPIDYLPRGGTS